MTRTRPLALILLVVVVTVSIGLTAAGATASGVSPPSNHTETASPTPTPSPTPTATATATPRKTPEVVREWEPPGPYAIEHLRQGGSKIPEMPASTRSIQGGKGVVWIMYMPVDPQEDEDFLDTETVIHSRKLGIKSTRLGEDIEELNATLHLVYWESGTKEFQTEDGTTSIRYAANQTHETANLTMGKFSDRTNVTLRGYYDDPRKLTMWLVVGGETVARWGPNTIRTNRLSEPVSIGNEQDYWTTTFWRFGWVLLIGLPLAFFASKKTLEQTIVGTLWGPAFWVAVVSILTLAFVYFAWYRSSVLLTQIPQIPGVLLVLVTYFVSLEVFGGSTDKAEFQQKDLQERTALTGDDPDREARHREIKHPDIVKQDGKIYLPGRGLTSLFARIWADPAKIDEKELKTEDRASGDVDHYYEVDPEAEHVLDITHAHLAFEPNVVREATDEEKTAHHFQLRQYDEYHPWVAAIATIPVTMLFFLKRVNWQWVGIAVGGFAASYVTFANLLGLPLIGGLLGVLPGVIAGTKAKDGAATVEFAPYHFNRADANLAYERQSYKEASTFEQLEEVIVEMDMAPLEQAQGIVDKVRQEYQDRMDRVHGGNGRREVEADD